MARIQSQSMILTQYLMLVALVLLTFAGLVRGQSETSSSASATSTTAVPEASIVQGTPEWEYYGCYNETTLTNGTGGLRALNGGVMEDLSTMTVDTCLNFCEGSGLAFAGLEYTRECYCAQHLSALSNKVDDSMCDLACIANDTQICGGSLKLTVYQAKSERKGAGSGLSREAPVGSILALGIAMAVLLCLA